MLLLSGGNGYLGGGGEGNKMQHIVCTGTLEGKDKYNDLRT